MASIPDLPHLYQTLVSGGFSESDQMLGRAIADALLLVGAISTGTLAPSALPNIGKHYGTAEARKAVAIAEAIKEKGLVFGTVPRDQLGGAAKEILETSKVFYVDKTDGDDIRNNGLTPNEPFKTISGSIDYIRSNYDLSGYTVTLLVSAGSYGPLDLRNLMLDGKLVISGQDIDPSKVKIERVDAENVVNDVVFDKLTVTDGFNLENCHTVKIKRAHFSCITAIQSRVKIEDYCHILPGHSEAYYIAVGSMLTATDTIHFIRQPLHWNRFIAVLDQSGAKFEGTIFDAQLVTGKRFKIGGSSYITTGTDDPNFFPGTLAGDVGANCSYDTLIGDAGKAIRVDNASNELKSTDLQGSLTELDKRLRKLEAKNPVSSFNDRDGEVYPKSDDYDANQITYRDGYLQEVVDQLVAGVDRLVRLPKVNSFNGRQGEIKPAKGDYNSDQILADGVPLSAKLGQLKEQLETLTNNVEQLWQAPIPVLDQDGLLRLQKSLTAVQAEIEKLKRAKPVAFDPGTIKADSIKTFNGQENVQSSLERMADVALTQSTALDKLFTAFEVTADEISQLSEKAEKSELVFAVCQKMIEANKQHIDNLWEKDEYHQHRGTTQVDTVAEYQVGPGERFESLQDVVDLVQTKLCVNRVLTIKLKPDYDPDREVVLVKGQHRGIGQVVITGKLPEMVFEGVFGYCIDNSESANGLIVSEGSVVDIQDSVFVPVGQGANLVVDRKSTVLFRGDTVLKGGTGLQFAAVEKQSQITFDLGSKLIVDAGNKYNLALMNAQFQSVLDVRQALIQSTHDDPIILKGQSLLIGEEALPDTTKVDCDEISSVIP